MSLQVASCGAAAHVYPNPMSCSQNYGPFGLWSILRRPIYKGTEVGP